MKILNEYISYLESKEAPLSAEVVKIRRKNMTVFFDCGSSDEAYEFINSCKGEKVVVLSHFHEDHSFNSKRLNVTIYCSKYTLKHIDNGQLYKSDEDFIIYDFPSFHSKGSLALYLPDFKILFIGDAIYPKGNNLYNLSIINNQIEFINNLDIEYIAVSHKKQFIFKKNVILNFLKFIKMSFKKDENIKEIEV